MPRYSPPLAWWYLKKQRQRREAGPIPPPPFDPSILFSNGEQGGLYDPSDLTTLFQDAAGTIPVTADGDPVGLMLDKSGNGNHLTQAATASRPTYRTDGVLHWLEFDGADDWLVTSAINWATDEVSMICGQEKLGSSAIGVMLEFSVNANTNNGVFAIYSPRGSSEQSYAAVSKGNSASQANSAVYVAPHKAVLTSLCKIGSDVVKIRVNTAETESSQDQGSGSSYGNYPLYIGRRAGTTFAWNGRLHGLIIRNVLTEGTGLTDAETWMAEKTGVTL